MAISKGINFTEELILLADYAKVLSHPARIEILQILAEKNSCICGDLVEELPLSQSTVSQHLKELKRIGIIKGEIEGKKSCYCIDWDKYNALNEAFCNKMNFILEKNINQSKCC